MKPATTNNISHNLRIYHIPWNARAKLKKPYRAGSNPNRVPRSERDDNQPELARPATAQLRVAARAVGWTPVATTSAWLKFDGERRSDEGSLLLGQMRGGL
jgi:hypothetical protein